MVTSAEPNPRKSELQPVDISSSIAKKRHSLSQQPLSRW